MNSRFLIREIVHSRNQGMVFILCVILSLISIVAVNSFRRDVRQSIVNDARNLHGSDIIVHSHYNFSPHLAGELRKLESELVAPVLRTWEFYSVARRADGKDSLLSNIKAVENSYPHYGEITLLSGRSFTDVLKPGTAVVGKSLLERLNLTVGDLLLLGDAALEIVDVVILESMRPVDFFNFGPRVLVSTDDLQKLGLVQKGSRVHHEVLLKTADETQMQTVVERLGEVSVLGQERIRTFKSSNSRIKRFFDNLLFFLSLISVFTLLLAGIGMQSSLAALLRSKEKSIAILKSIGATGPFLFYHYFGLVLFFSVIGCGLGIIGGALFEKSFVYLFAGLLPGNIELGVSFLDVVEGVGLGLLAVFFFTFLPLNQIKESKPANIFRKGTVTRTKKREIVVFWGPGLLLLAGLVVRQLEDIQIALYFISGVIGLIVVISLFAHGGLALLRRTTIPSLALRQASRSLLRPGNATRSIVVTLGSAFAVLLTIFLVESNLHSTYIASYPEDAPNLFCLDIQKNQRQPFLNLVGEEVELFPVIRARLSAINNKKIQRGSEQKKRGDSLTREFNLTYRESLLQDEHLLKGEGLFGQTKKERRFIPVSVLDSVAKMGKMKIGDILDFNIQGVPLKAKIQSIRGRNKSMLYPFFYFVFPTKDLEVAPQTFFGALKVDTQEISKYENDIVNRFPNISTINVTETAIELGEMMQKLSTIVIFFASFSILAGGLILVSSILATRLERMKEAVYYKILGGSRGFVTRVFLLENMILALLSGFCATIVAQAGSWALCHFVFGLDYSPNWLGVFVALASAVVLLISLGLISSRSIIGQKPSQFLKEHWS